MTLKDLGFNESAQKLTSLEENANELGRVIVEHKERYVIQTPESVYQAEITGKLRFSAESRADLPAVGDWVTFSVFDDNAAIIIEVMPRYSTLERKAVNKFGEKQIIAANVDVAFIMQAVGHDFNLNRLERYIAICSSSYIRPVIVLSKTDLVEQDEVHAIIASVQKRIHNVPVYPISNETLSGYEELKKTITPGNTYCILGSSGVGKSSLANNLLKSAKFKVNAISDSTQKGKHTTSHRELMVLPEGGVLIDTPGMRELGMAGDSEGIDQTFDQISLLAQDCKFKDCTHIEEPDCAVIEALESGELDQSTYENYHKLKREQEHFSSTVAERRAKDKKLGKLYKRIKEEKQKRR